ncbi:type VII secretion protein EccE [Mycobacterium simulans]
MWGLTVARVLPTKVAGSTIVLTALALLVPLHEGRSLAHWGVLTIAFIARHGRSVPRLPAPTDILVASGTAGIRCDGRTLLTAIELRPALAITDIGVGIACTTNAVPVRLLAQCMHQYGIDLSIDVVSIGQEVSLASCYGPGCAQTVGQRTLVGRRRTWLLLRLDVLANLPGITARGPSGTAAPRVLAAACHRVAQRLRENGIDAHALTAKQLDEMTDLFLEHSPLDQVRERWSTMRTADAYVKTFMIEPNQLTNTHLDRWWASPATSTAVTVRLVNANDGPRVGGLVRYVTAECPCRKYPCPNPGALLSSVSIQRRLFEATLPGGDRSLRADIPTLLASDLDSLSIATEQRVRHQQSAASVATARHRRHRRQALQK